ncbi:MAG: glycosyltransferase family 9 protein [Leptospiraceae bacterium]|nr:glycosyltransferase family 9 protein [Leptospiraceae bacterium]
MQRLLIVSKLSLGDVILQIGIVQALKKTLPQLEIFFACDERNAPALKSLGEIREVIALKLNARGRSESFRAFLRRIRSLDCDALLIFGRDSEAVLAGYLARIPVRAGIRNQRYGFLLTRALREHDSELNSFEFYHKLAAQIVPELPLTYPTISVDKKTAQKLRQSLARQKLPRRFILWHIGASLEEKRYPVFQIIETLRLFRKNRIGLPVLFAGGPGDDAFMAELENAVKESGLRFPKIFFADKIPFNETAALITLAQLVVANDAAPRHIAAALRKKCLTLMPRHRRHWQVYGEKEKAYFLFSDAPPDSRAVDTIEPAEVAGTIRKLL